MRKIWILSTVVLAALISSCNSGTTNDSGKDSITITTATDSTMSGSVDTVPALPAIPAGAKVYFKNLKNGQEVSSPVKIEFGQEGIALAPKGAVVDSSGHHHLIVDGDFIPAGTVIPDDSTHFHYGKAQTEATITLTPGKHKLTMQYGDGIHRSYGEKLSSTITVNVK